MKNTLFGAIAFCLAALLGACPGTAQSRESVKVGVLVCGIEGGTGYIVGSVKELRCIFYDDTDRERERYVGEVRKYGLDIGVTDKTELRWVVFAPSSKLGLGALAGRYIGAAVDAAVGVGAGAKVLVGGSDRTISLQPLSLQGQTGLNAAVGVAALDLVPYNKHAPLK